MKTSIKFFSMLIMMMALCVGFTACSSDDDDAATVNNSELNVVGYWVCYPNYDKEMVVLELKANGTCSYSWNDDNEYEQGTGSWSLNGDKLKLTLTIDGDTDVMTFTIVSLKGDIMVLEDTEEGYKFTFER